MDGYRIQALKESPKMTYMNLNIGAAISPKLYNLSWKVALKMLVFGIFFVPKFDLENYGKNKIIFSRSFLSSSRPDFNEIYSFVSSSCHSNRWSFCRILKFGSSLSSLRTFTSVFSKNYSLNLSFTERLAVSSLECFYRKVVEKLYLMNWDDYDCYISFCDSYLEENLAAQLAKLKGLRTITLQHGQFKNSGPAVTTDSEAYLNFISDYMLIWGKATEDQLVSAGVSRDRLLLSGVPKFVYNYGMSSTVYDNSLSIYLNGDNHFDSNKKMVEACVQYCEEFGIGFFILRHPTSLKKLEQSIYKSGLFKGFSQEVNNYSLLNVVNSSGVLLDLLMKNVQVAVFVDASTNDLYRQMGLDFCDSIELARAFKSDKVQRNSKAREYFNHAKSEEDAKVTYARHLSEVVRK